MQTNLKKAQIGKTGLEVTRIGMGGAPIGKGDIDIAVERLETAYREGIRYFDTAPLYGTGRSEIFYGNFLPTNSRDDFSLSTKEGRL